jgi:hypothetical protein
MRLRTGETTEEDWNYLLTRTPSAVPSLDQFRDAIRLYYGNEQVATYNYTTLLELHQPIAYINARHSSPVAKGLPPDDMAGLVPTLFLAKQASVMLTMNLWPKVGL